MDAAMEAGMELQQKEQEWLEWEVGNPDREAHAKRRKIGGALFRQKSHRSLLELDNQLRCPPFDGPGLRCLQAPAKLANGVCWGRLLGFAVYCW